MTKKENFEQTVKSYIESGYGGYLRSGGFVITDDTNFYICKTRTRWWKDCFEQAKNILENLIDEYQLNKDEKKVIDNLLNVWWEENEKLFGEVEDE